MPKSYRLDISDNLTTTLTDLTPPAPVSPLGANLSANRDYSLALPFVDLQKQARQFTSLARAGQPASVDPSGWPLEDFEVIFQSVPKELTKVFTGVYKLSFSGHAAVVPANSPVGLQQTAGGYDVLVNGDTMNDWYLRLRFTGVAPGISNIKLIRPGYDPIAPPTFGQEFLDALKPFSVLRMMDWGQTNNSTIQEWSNRTQPTNPYQAGPRGVALEYQTQLCNYTGKDMWLCIPHLASDDYVTAVAAYLKSALDPTRNVYVENSNELWNFGFSQASQNRDAAVAEVAAYLGGGPGSNLFLPGETAFKADGKTYVHDYDWALRRNARRIKQIGYIFGVTWGMVSPRLRPVLSGQFANPYTLGMPLQWLKTVYGVDPSVYLYGVSAAPYFYSARDNTNPGTLTADDILVAMATSAGFEAAAMPKFIGVAKTYGLQALAYEGGPDTFGQNNIAAKAAAQLDARMGDLCTNLLQAWFSQGGGLFNWFVAGATNYNTAYGCWGTTNDPTNLATPKQAALAKMVGG